MRNKRSQLARVQSRGIEGNFVSQETLEKQQKQQGKLLDQFKQQHQQLQKQQKQQKQQELVLQQVQLFNNFKKLQQQQQQQQVGEGQARGEERDECILCFEQGKRFCIVPCGHKLLCADCGDVQKSANV
jgi:hypothetical protein